MALLSKFFKPKWQHANPDVRRQAITDLKTDEQRITFIQAESVAELRQLAVAQVQSEQELEKLLSHNHQDVRDTARQTWLERLLNGQQSLSAIHDNQTLIRIASLTNDQQQRLEAVSRITDQNERLQLAMNNPVAKVRLAAAEGINDSDKLQQLMAYAQGKDKAVYRLCKDRLNASKAERDAQQALQTRIQTLLANAEQLNRLGYNPEFNGRYQVISKEWQTLSEQASSELQTAMQQQLDQAQATLTQHAEEEARQAQQQQAAQQAQSQQAGLLQTLETLLADTLATRPDAEGIQQLHQQIETLEANWRDANQAHKASAEENRQFENQLQQLFAIQTALSHFAEKQDELNEWLAKPLATDLRGLTNTQKQAQQWQKQLHWPLKAQDNVQQPGWVSQIQEKLDQANAALDEMAKQQKSRLQTIDEQLAKLEQALAEGHAKDASKLNQQVQQNLRQVDNKVSQDQQRKAKSLNAQLNEMRDWQGYAITPKKEALCTAMEALVDADISADVLADKIHELQEEWKTLGSAQPDRDLWQRFQAAGDKAFEPCREYFAQLAEKRQQFVAARQALTAELISYEQQLDWQSADWKVVQKTLDAAREAFRSYSPVDRAAHKDTQKAFQDACDAIYAHLKQEYDRNLAAKAELVTQAEALVEQEDLSAAIDRVKSLQQEWKNIGVTPRNPDQKLWKQFRTACDGVFSRLDSEKAQRKAQINDAVTQAESLVAQAQALADNTYTDAAAVNEAQNQLAELRQQFSAIELPRSAHQRLVKQLQGIDNALQSQQQTIKQAKERARWNGLIDRLQAIATQDNDAFAAAAELPAGYNATLFEQALKGELTQPDNTNNNDAQAIVISLEVLADIESPEADKGRRMELQVQKLAQGLGQGLGKDAERQQLVEQWLEVVNTADAALNTRFIEALKASL
ncbi:DUF349 domain-containing protein [Bacterioplanoides sp.]|uniref:DUF349 domain-containing protein n=1 Tax=Bacterioplanoides sp. TaxID=2066072 RepID=UPI003B003135